MPRQIRIAKGNTVYHVLNRANGRLKIFKTARDFAAFEAVLAEGAERFGMRVCGYCLMSNHWHRQAVGMAHPTILSLHRPLRGGFSNITVSK